MSENWTKMTACDLGRGIESGEIDPVELTQTFLTSIKSNAFRDTIYARLTEARALSEADAAAERARTQTRRSLLDGVPISWKDLYDTVGVATESGSTLLKDRIPEKDAVVLTNATNAGLVCLGKTHQTELAFSGLGLNPVTETPPNAFNPSLAPGGSSSGAAVSTAMGLAAAGIGSDTGGSVRIPSAWNDLVGLKTTSGRLSLKGVVPLCARFDTVGPLCRSVEDASHLLAVMEKGKPIDLKGAHLKDRRFFVCESVALDDCDSEISEGFESAVEKLADAGAIIERGPIPEVARAMPLAGCLFTSEAYGTWRDEIEANPQVMYPPVLARFRAGAEFTAAEYVRGWQQLDALREAFNARMAGFDGILAPTSPILPPDAKRLLNDEAYFTDRNLLALRNTRIGNLLGLCALTLPTSIRHCGLMIMGRPLDEGALLRVGAAVESVLRD